MPALTGWRRGVFCAKNSEDLTMLAINRAVCKNCGLCMVVCPRKVFEKVDGNIEPVNIERCNTCGHCIAVCHSDAITHSELPADSFRDIPQINISAADLKVFLESKRSCRHFRDIEVEKDVIAEIIDVGRFAPSDKNTQRRGFIVVTDRELIKKLDIAVIDEYRKLLKLLPAVSRKVLGTLLPVVRELDIAASGLMRMIQNSDNGESPVFHNAPCVIFTYGPKGVPLAKDTAVATQHYMMLIGQAMGLGSCIIGYAQSRPKTISRILDVPKGQIILSATIFGYPAVKYGKIVPRNKPEVKYF